MPSIVPLKDGKLQSVLDLNNYSFINDRGLKRLPIFNINTSSYEVSSGSIGYFFNITSSGFSYFNINAGLIGIEPGDWFAAGSSNSSSTVNVSGSATIFNGYTPTVNIQGSVHQFIYVGYDSWLQLNFN